MLRATRSVLDVAEVSDYAPQSPRAGGFDREGRMPTNLVPKRLYLTNGVGVHAEKLQSFELALRDAGIAYLNLVAVSSIYPPGCRIVARAKGEEYLEPGQIAFVVMSRSESNEPHRMIAASIGVAVPSGPPHVRLPLGAPRVRADRTRRPGTTPRTWRPRCWPPRWAWSSTRTSRGTRSARSGRSPTRS